METTEQERALWDQIKALDPRVLQVDNVPRVSGYEAAFLPSGTLCLCVKLWSERRQEAAYAETWYDKRLLEDADLNVASALWSGPCGIEAAFLDLEQDLE